jgi:tRNA pseudouridine38-40 synthase
MRNLGILISYDGTNYSGFQAQPFKNTIQDKIEEAILALTGEQVKLVGSGRTDAGVHALGQVANFETRSPIPTQRWRLALNGRLPHDIVIRDVYEVPLNFHSRRMAKRKTYQYTINNSRVPDVFGQRYQYFHPTPLDLSAMMEAIACIHGEHDFSTFCSRKSTKSSHVRTIYEAQIIIERSDYPDHEGRNGIFHIMISGNGFLYNMVRVIAGTLVQIGEGKRPASDMAHILSLRDRSAAGPTAVAQGLCLMSVEY